MMPPTLRRGLFIVLSAASFSCVASPDASPAYASDVAGCTQWGVDTARRFAKSQHFAPTTAIDLVTHGSIEIGRPAMTVWPLIVRSNSWTHLRLVHRGGPVQQVGELLCVVDPSKAEIGAYAENVELDPGHRRAFKVYGKDDQLGGYVIWTLDETAGRTVVSYDLYYEWMLPESERHRVNDPTYLEERRRQEHERASKKIDAELLTLKNLVESK